MTRKRTPVVPLPDPSLVDLYERPIGLGIMMKAELVMMTMLSGTLQFLMFRREQAPYDSAYSLPGRYLNEYLNVDETASAIGKTLKVKCGSPHLFCLYSNPDRNPQHRAISAGYLCVANRYDMVDLTQRDPRFKLVSFDPQAATAYMAQHAPFAPDPSTPVRAGTNMMLDGELLVATAFDHAAIIRDAFIHLQDTLDHTMLAFELLPEKFTLFELQKVHESILLRPLEKVLFRKRMIARTFVNGTKLRPCAEQRETAGRPAQLYELHRQPLKPKIEHKD
jgi:8-oxo-dGTP diphosphatase